MNKAQYNKLMITMIMGGLTFIISIFAYAHTTFTTKDIEKKQNSRINRIDDRNADRFKSIEGKLDQILMRLK